MNTTMKQVIALLAAWAVIAATGFTIVASPAGASTIDVGCQARRSADKEVVQLTWTEIHPQSREDCTDTSMYVADDALKATSDGRALWCGGVPSVLLGVVRP